MKNEHSETGIAEDMIRSIVQIGCAEVHAKTLYEKAMGELEEGIIDVEDRALVEEHMDKINGLCEEINSLADLRRKTMLALFEMFDGDKTYWCQIKHLGVGAYTLFEAYQASDDDRDLLDLALEANKAFVRAMSSFLGVEITECSACFSDAIKARLDERSNDNG